jgi:hypothetical protein
MEVSGQLHTSAALPLGRELPVLIEEFYTVIVQTTLFLGLLNDTVSTEQVIHRRMGDGGAIMNTDLERTCRTNDWRDWRKTRKEWGQPVSRTGFAVASRRTPLSPSPVTYDTAGRKPTTHLNFVTGLGSIQLQGWSRTTHWGQMQKHVTCNPVQNPHGDFIPQRTPHSRDGAILHAADKCPGSSVTNNMMHSNDNRSTDQQFPAFYSTQRFITVFTRACHWSLS